MNNQQNTIAAQIADLHRLSMPELWTLWDRYFPRRPDYPNRTHVESRIAYKLQEEAFGGLATETKSAWKRLAQSTPRSSYEPGLVSLLLRRAPSCCANGVKENTRSRSMLPASSSMKATPSEV